MRDVEEEDGVVACTMEALICPDGSGVGRQGPDCQFAACPHQPFLVGTLEQSEDGGFRLTLDSEVGSEYAVPLELRVSNALADLVGTEVRVYGSFTTGSTYEVETIEPTTAASILEARIDLGASTSGVTIIPLEVLEDSRCPIDVICVQAGTVRLRAELQSGLGTAEQVFVLGQPITTEAEIVTLTEVRPSRIADEEIVTGEYQFVFRVEER